MLSYDEMRYYLGLLRMEMENRGFRARLSGQPPTLAVINEKAAALDELITVSEAGWFKWSWDEAFCPVSDFEAAAQQIAYVLTPKPAQI